MSEEIYVWSKADIVDRGQDDSKYVMKGDFLELEECFVDSERRLDMALVLGKEMAEALRAARALWGDFIPAGNSNAMKAMKLVDAAIAKAELADEGDIYRFETGPYEVELSADQWSQVHSVFENYNQSSNADDEFTIEESSINGLVSEILIALELAQAD
jgi:hypothetical protein